LLYAAWWGWRYADAWAPLDAQRAWRPDGAQQPIATLVDAASLAWRFQRWWLVDLVIVAIAVVGIVLAARAVPLTYTIYAAASLAIPLLLPLADRPLMSVPRFVAVV